jgi:hypothetical protein
LSKLLFGLVLSSAFIAAADAQEAGPAASPDIEAMHAPFNAQDASAFREPPKVFHPETWFHFIGGNVAKPGITADLQAIAGAGISGVQLFHGQFGGSWPGVEPQIKCLSGPWDDAVLHVSQECRRLGLRFTMQNCPGWAMAGGPWIPPDKAMRNLVWSRTDVAGGRSVSIALPQPEPSREAWRDYRDVAVIAFPRPDGDTGKALKPFKVKSNRGDLPWARCLSKEDGGGITLQPGKEPVWFEATFEKVVTLRTVEFPSVQKFNHPWCYDPGVTITVFAVVPEGLRQVARHEIPESNWQDNQPISLACSDVPAKAYRVVIDNKHSMSFSYIQLFTAARKNNWESEAATTLRGLDRAPQAQQTKTAWVNASHIVDLTNRMDAHGKLDWNAPPGDWTVLRFGHVNSGHRNGPAPPEGTGWECDKLSPIGAETHFAGYIGRLVTGKGVLAGGGLQGILFDSWECETQTWTPGMDAQFKRMRGYELLPWLPALTGCVVGDPETTGRFLRDWRTAISDLMVENFFGRMESLAHANHLSITYETAPGDVFPGDILEYYKHADVPMCEFWQPRSEAFVGSFEFKPVKPCVSAARMYGKTRVAAESFTCMNLNWNDHPAMLKPIADMHMAEGVTHVMFHTYTHNPRTDFLPPGTSFGSGIGTPFLRGQTWWPEMDSFTAYLSRCSYLLERGRPVSDVLWYLGDEQDHKPLQAAPFPAGYHYDYCNPDVLLHRLSVRDGCWITPEGLQYRLLWLRDCPRMLPDTLKKMVELVRQGAVIVGEPPRGLATLSGGEDAQRRLDRAVETLWGARRASGKAASGVRQVGDGFVLSGMTIDEALAQRHIQPDLEGGGVVWNHRQAEGANWYFVATSPQQQCRGTLRFRSTGVVEIWDPMTGETTSAGVMRRDGATTLVALDLPPSASRFVVFRHVKDTVSNPVVRVEYNGKVVADAQAPRSAASDLKVISASYGDPTIASRRVDVADRVRGELAKGMTAVVANNDWAGSDPALGTRKKVFAVVQAANEKPKQFEGWEGEPVSLFDASSTPRAACEVSGGGKLIAWESGDYRLTREDGTIITRTTKLTGCVLLEGPWNLAFPPGWGAPASVQVNRLKSWTELNLPPEAQAFAGTATYATDFDLDKLPDGARAELDLGQVEVIAKVELNGQSVGTAWAPPYRLDSTRFLKPGVNHLKVEVTNTWFNRLAYDAGLPEKNRKTWTINGPGGGSPLKPAGLLGPVTVRLGHVIDITPAHTSLNR